MKRKRARGAGRKPKVGFSTSSLTFRIPDDMRRHLEAEASEKNASIAERLVWHLRRSFNRQRDEERDPSLHGLLLLIANLAEVLSQEGPDSEFGTYWRTNWFTFRAFKVAVGKLLADLNEPPTPAHYPFTEEFLKQAIDRMVKDGYDPEYARLWMEIHKSPEALGAFVFSRLGEHHSRPGPFTSMDRAYIHHSPTIERDIRALPNAMEALELKPKSANPKDKADD
jgi:hypothetical protein